MLAKKEDKNLLRENTRLNFISVLQTPLLPTLLSLQGILRPFREALSGQVIKVSVQSFLFAVWCSSLVSYVPQVVVPLRDEPALLWAYPQPRVSLGPYVPWVGATVPWGVHALPSRNCSSVSLFVPSVASSLHSSVLS